MLWTILVVVAVLGVLAFAATRPDSFRVQRSRHVRAPAETLYDIIVDLRRWQAWSPWEKLDPGMQRRHAGAERGVGAVYEWNGNNKVGAGRMEIVEAERPQRVLIKLDFRRPFSGNNHAEFTLVRDGDGTMVTWSLFGPSPYLSKVMGLFMSMDRMIGAQYERGLADLAALAEAEAQSGERAERVGKTSA